MNCLQAEEHFSAHFEDTLDYQTLQDFDGHLSACEACQREYTRFQGAVKSVQHLPQIEPSPYFMSTLQQRLDTVARDPRGITEVLTTGWKQVLDVFRRPKWAVSGLMALILAAAGAYFYQENPLFTRELRPVPAVTLYEQEQRTMPADTFSEGSRRSVRELGEVVPMSVMPAPARPMQQRYLLKQVSYTNASTSGGL